MKEPIIIIIVFLLTGMGFNTRAQQINIWQYNIQDGLVNNDILSIYEDSRGFIWLCTRGGLSRYDGSRFTNFTTENGLGSNMINDIYEVAPQEFLIAQNADGPRLFKNNTITVLPGGNKMTLNKFYTVKNRVIATTDLDGIVEWDKSSLKPFNPAYTRTITQMSVLDDSIWLLLHLPFSIQFASPFLQHWTEVFSLNATAVFKDSHHRTWIGTTHGLKLLDPASKPGKGIAFLPLPAPFDLPLLREAYIDDMMEDSQGNIWIGTFNGLVRVDKNGHSRFYTQQDGLPASQINCLKEDRQHNIWIGTPLGLVKFSLTDVINTFRLDLGPSHDGTIGVLPVTETSWQIFDGKNIGRLDLGTGKLTNNLLSNSDYSIYHLNEEEFLIHANRRALIYHSGKEQAETLAWPDKVFSAAIRKDPRSFLSASTDTLFTISNGNAIEKFKTGVKSHIHKLVIDKNNFLWAATWNHGILKISPGRNNDSIRSRIIDSFAGRLPDQNIRTLYTNKKNELWIGTRYKGVVRLLELPGGKYELQNYGTREGLSSDFVLSISGDQAGNIWVGSIQGIDKLIPKGKDYRIFNFGKVNKVFSKVYYIRFPGNKYLLATGYPSLLYIRDMQQDTLPPPVVYITRIAAGPADTSFTTNSVLRLPTNKAQIYFEFSAPQFINEDFTKYSYRLLGYGDTSWKLSGKSRSVYFASLKPGAYTFEIRALGFNDQWGKPASYRFIVNTPFWQEAWFILLVIAAVGLLIYTLYRYRVKQLIRIQKVRNRIASDLHDEIGSNLTNISILSVLSKQNLAQPHKAGDFLKRISDEVSSSSQALDDIIWSVNTSHDTLEETVARMRRYAAELFDAANISYELYLDPAFEEKKLDMEQRRDVYLLYKEAINNISKHASAKQVSIQVSIDRNQLFLTIRDDGKGFDTQKQSERHGLEGMKERVKKWKGIMTLQSNMNKGTMVHISMPLSK